MNIPTHAEVVWRLGETRHQRQNVVPPPLCFSRFYPAYFKDRYRSRTGKDSENEIGCGFLDWKLGAFYRFWAGVLICRSPSELRCGVYSEKSYITHTVGM